MRILVLMGGSSMERDVSLATGRGIARALAAAGHEVVPLDPAPGRRLALDALEGHAIAEAPAGGGKGGRVPDGPAGERNLALARSPELGAAEVVFVALHGGIGEDGTLQALLDLAGVPYTGSGMLASALAMDKQRAKMMLRSAGVPTPDSAFLSHRGVRPDVDALGGYPVVVKPNAQGSSVGVHIVERAADLEPALEDAFGYGPVLVERFIPGREVTVAVLDGEPLPLVEIIPEAGFYDYRHKYTKGHTRYEVPARVSGEAAAEASRLGAVAYDALGCAGVARVDFRLAPDGGLYCLEVNTVPGMTETSLVPMAAGARGMSYGDLVERLVASALERRR